MSTCRCPCSASLWRNGTRTASCQMEDTLPEHNHQAHRCGVVRATGTMPDARRARITERSPGVPPMRHPRSEHPYDVAGLQADRALVGEALGPTLVGLRPQPVLVGGAGLAAGQPVRARHRALGDHRDGHVLEDLQDALDALAIRRQAVAAASPAQPVAKHPQRSTAHRSADPVRLHQRLAQAVAGVDLAGSMRS